MEITGNTGFRGSGLGIIGSGDTLDVLPFFRSNSQGFDPLGFRFWCLTI